MFKLGENKSKGNMVKGKVPSMKDKNRQNRAPGATSKSMLKNSIFMGNQKFVFGSDPSTKEGVVSLSEERESSSNGIQSTSASDDILSPATSLMSQ